MKTGLIGLGTIGTPIAHKLFNRYRHDFFLLASEMIKQQLLSQSIYVNGDLFDPEIYSDQDEKKAAEADLLIICVKNYDLETSIGNIRPFVKPDTILLPLQNGIYSYELFHKTFPENPILRGYVQGPNTEIVSDGFYYKHPGDIHIGCEEDEELARKIVEYMKVAGVPITFETRIKRMVWKKWMLNVAGNSVTALTGADYSLFKKYTELQKLCRDAMGEFLTIARAENVDLDEKDIDDIIDYYVSYVGSKKTSMLMDVIYKRKTENDYLAGTALQLGEKHDIPLPIISTLYYLIKMKEAIYCIK